MDYHKVTVNTIEYFKLAIPIYLQTGIVFENIFSIVSWKYL